MRRGTVTAWLTPVVVMISMLLVAAPVARGNAPNVVFLSTGDPVEGWQWLRDANGDQYATWSIWGTPTGAPATIELKLLATDGVNGGPGVDARAWVMVGPIESGAPGPAIVGPSLLTFPNVSAPDDPVGYTTHGTLTIPPEDLPADMEGLWILVQRRGPTGEVLPEHLAVNREALSVIGLAAPVCEHCLPVPQASPAA